MSNTSITLGVVTDRIGLELARLADLPEAVTSEARRITIMLDETEKERKKMSMGTLISIRRKAVLSVGTY